MKSLIDNKIPAQYQTKWMEFQPSQNSINSIVIVLHGLNQIPADMDELCQDLAKYGHYVIRGFLFGHEDKEFCQSIKASDWMQDTYALIEYGKLRAKEFNVKLNSLAFSTGNLCFLNALNNYKKNEISKSVMIAPPIVMTSLGAMARAFTVLPDKIIIPSPDPQNTSRACAKVNASYYKAFFQTKDYFHKTLNPKHNIPTLLMGHLKDEIINTRKFDHFISRHNMDNWETFTLTNEKLRKGSYYHLIVSVHDWGLIVYQMAQKVSNWLEN